VKCLLVLAALARLAHADPDDGRRWKHVAVIAALGAGYTALDLEERSLTPAACRWCTPTSFDVSVRDALRWNTPNRAATISTVTAFTLVPAVTGGLLVWCDRDIRERFDELVPIAESGLAALTLAQIVKPIVARQRPFSHFGGPSDNDSFYSGHATAAFAMAIAAGEVARARGKNTAAIYASGLALAATAAYLRIAADQHYVTDVAVGAVTGALVGYAWPHVADRYLYAPVPTPSGIAVVGSF